MRPLIAANWKMNTLPSEVTSWAGELAQALQTGGYTAADIAICPPLTHLPLLRDALPDGVALGAQDVSAHDMGAYTGEVSAEMLRDLGVTYAIIGHSERREYHHESDEIVNSKVRTALKHDLVPILCVGESLEQREAGDTEEVVLRQLRAALKGVTLPGADALVVAYEPIWAIGTGKSATTQDAQEVCAEIRHDLEQHHPELAPDVRILYGGSMKADNAQELLAQADINGGLVGGASLVVASLLAIVESA